jgi:putative ABC transport system permease protein
MAGSIAFLKLLRKNKQYYYKTKHFITVSGMLYRMKQNAVGLANICILSTMVMVIISTTVCMYAGLEDALAKSKELNLSFYYKEYPTQEQRNYLQEQMQQIVTAQGRKMTDMSEYSYIPYIIHSEGNTIDIFQRDAGYSNTDMGMIRVFSKEDYEKYLGCSLPEDADGMAFINSSQRIEGTSVQLFGQSWQVQDITELVKGKLDNDEQYSQMVEDMIDFVVADMEAVKQIDQSAGGKYDITYEITANIDGTKEEKKQCAEALKTQMDDCGEQGGYDARMLICTADQREMYLELNGGFLFLGLFLGTMFLMITVLIIYYKQISEGYEDRERFAIMTKVGMSSSEVKAAIRSQVRTIFFLPITVAVMHLVAAFPMLKLMLLLFNIKNTVLFIWCLAGTVVVFFILYFTVFKLTSRRYYQIVYQ